MNRFPQGETSFWRIFNLGSMALGNGSGVFEGGKPGLGVGGLVGKVGIGEL